MKLQAIYRGRKYRSGFDDFKSKRMVEINERKRNCVEKCLQSRYRMYRGWKARKELKEDGRC